MLFASEGNAAGIGTLPHAAVTDAVPGRFQTLVTHVQV